MSATLIISNFFLIQVLGYIILQLLNIKKIYNFLPERTLVICEDINVRKRKIKSKSKEIGKCYYKKKLIGYFVILFNNFINVHMV